MVVLINNQIGKWLGVLLSFAPYRRHWLEHTIFTIPWAYRDVRELNHEYWYSVMNNSVLISYGSDRLKPPIFQMDHHFIRNFTLPSNILENIQKFLTSFPSSWQQHILLNNQILKGEIWTYPMLVLEQWYRRLLTSWCMPRLEPLQKYLIFIYFMLKEHSFNLIWVVLSWPNAAWCSIHDSSNNGPVVIYALATRDTQVINLLEF